MTRPEGAIGWRGRSCAWGQSARSGRARWLARAWPCSLRTSVEADLRRGVFRKVFPAVKPVSDWFRLVFRADDPRRSLYETLAARMLQSPLR